MAIHTSLKLRMTGKKIQFLMLAMLLMITTEHVQAMKGGSEYKAPEKAVSEPTLENRLTKELQNHVMENIENNNLNYKNPHNINQDQLISTQQNLNKSTPNKRFTFEDFNANGEPISKSNDQLNLGNNAQSNTNAEVAMVDENNGTATSGNQPNNVIDLGELSQPNTTGNLAPPMPLEPAPTGPAPDDVVARVNEFTPEVTTLIKSSNVSPERLEILNNIKNKEVMTAQDFKNRTKGQETNITKGQETNKINYIQYRTDKFNFTALDNAGKIISSGDLTSPLNKKTISEPVIEINKNPELLTLNEIEQLLGNLQNGTANPQDFAYYTQHVQQINSILENMIENHKTNKITPNKRPTSPTSVAEQLTEPLSTATTYTKPDGTIITIPKQPNNPLPPKPDSLEQALQLNRYNGKMIQDQKLVIEPSTDSLMSESTAIPVPSSSTSVVEQPVSTVEAPKAKTVRFSNNLTEFEPTATEIDTKSATTSPELERTTNKAGFLQKTIDKTRNLNSPQFDTRTKTNGKEVTQETFAKGDKDKITPLTRKITDTTDGSYKLYDQSSKLTSERTPDGNVISYKYDAQGRKTQSIENRPDKSTATTLFDANGNPTQTIIVSRNVGKFVNTSTITTIAYKENSNQLKSIEIKDNKKSLISSQVFQEDGSYEINDRNGSKLEDKKIGTSGRFETTSYDKSTPPKPTIKETTSEKGEPVSIIFNRDGSTSTITTHADFTMTIEIAGKKGNLYGVKKAKSTPIDFSNEIQQLKKAKANQKDAIIDNMTLKLTGNKNWFSSRTIDASILKTEAYKALRKDMVNSLKIEPVSWMSWLGSWGNKTNSKMIDEAFTTTKTTRISTQAKSSLTPDVMTTKINDTTIRRETDKISDAITITNKHQNDPTAKIKVNESSVSYQPGSGQIVMQRANGGSPVIIDIATGKKAPGKPFSPKNPPQQTVDFFNGDQITTTRNSKNSADAMITVQHTDGSMDFYLPDSKGKFPDMKVRPLPEPNARITINENGTIDVTTNIPSTKSTLGKSIAAQQLVTQLSIDGNQIDSPAEPINNQAPAAKAPVKPKEITNPPIIKPDGTSITETFNYKQGMFRNIKVLTKSIEKKPDGTITTQEFNRVTGKLDKLQIQDPQGNITQRVFDSLGRKRKEKINDGDLVDFDINGKEIPTTNAAFTGEQSTPFKESVSAPEGSNNYQAEQQQRLIDNDKSLRAANNQVSASAA